MKSIALITLSLIFQISAYAQVLEDYIMLDANAIDQMLETRPDACPIDARTAEWVNPDQMSPERAMSGKFSIVHFAAFDNVQSAHNIEVLTSIQKDFPKVRIFLVNRPRGQYPSTQNEIADELSLLGAPFPVLRDSTGKWSECMGIAMGPTTLFLSPKGKIMQQKDGLLYYKQLKGAMDNVIPKLEAIKPMDPMPFLGRVPNHNQKLPILRYPANIEINPIENFLYVSDFIGNRVIGITPFGDMITSIGTGQPGFLDGNLSSAQFNGPQGMAFDKETNVLYIADSKNHRIRKADLNTEEVTTFLGSGRIGTPGQRKVSGTGGHINHPTDLLLDGNKLYIAMGGTSEIWVCDVRTAVAERYAGTGVYGHKDGKLLEAELGQPMGLALDISGALFFSDAASSSIRSIDKGVVTTVAGGGMESRGYKDGKNEEILFQSPRSMTSVNGDLYIADSYNHCIRKLEPFKKRSETVVGSGSGGYLNGNGSDAMLYKPSDVKHLSDALYIADSGNGLIRKYDLVTKNMSTISLANHGLLGQGYLEMITDIRDGDTVRVGNGYNEIAIEIDLGEQYELDYGGHSSVGLTAREDSIQLVAPGFDNGIVHIGFHAEDVQDLSNFTLDFNLFFKSKEQGERQYYRAVSFMYFVVKDEKSGNSHRLVTTFDPDADPWLVDETGEMD